MLVPQSGAAPKNKNKMKEADSSSKSPRKPKQPVTRDLNETDVLAWTDDVVREVEFLAAQPGDRAISAVNGKKGTPERDVNIQKRDTFRWNLVKTMRFTYRELGYTDDAQLDVFERVADDYLKGTGLRYLVEVYKRAMSLNGGSSDVDKQDLAKMLFQIYGYIETRVREEMRTPDLYGEDDPEIEHVEKDARDQVERTGMSLDPHTRMTLSGRGGVRGFVAGERRIV